MTINAAELFQTLPYQTFFEILDITPKQVKEFIFHKYGVKVKSAYSISQAHETKNHKKIKKFYSMIQEGIPCSESEELIRNWLYTKRPMLKATMDFLGVKNEDGLTEEEIDFIEKLDQKTVDNLIQLLKPNFPLVDVVLYLNFMKFPHLDDLYNEYKQGPIS